MHGRKQTERADNTTKKKWNLITIALLHISRSFYFPQYGRDHSIVLSGCERVEEASKQESLRGEDERYQSRLIAMRDTRVDAVNLGLM